MKLFERKVSLWWKEVGTHLYVPMATEEVLILGLRWLARERYATSEEFHSNKMPAQPTILR